MMHLQYEIRICHKPYNKVTITLCFYYEIACIRRYVSVPQKTEGPRVYARYMCSSARAGLKYGIRLWFMHGISQLSDSFYVTFLSIFARINFLLQLKRQIVIVILSTYWEKVSRPRYLNKLRFNQCWFPPEIK